ncbi:uncharacterized protein METZ01_LOCUS240042, partial [marine metagenome]
MANFKPKWLDDFADATQWRAGKFLSEPVEQRNGL